MAEKTVLNWQVGWSDSADEAPARMVPAQVPGAVQLDWARAEGWGDHTYGENWRQYGWMEDKYWTYRARIEPTLLSAEERLIFVSLGIDYSFRVLLNGEELLRQEGMFTPVELDVTDAAGAGGTLEIIVDPAPKRTTAPHDRSQAAHSCKPAVSYGWDWHPRLVTLGIWDETYLTSIPSHRLTEAEVIYTLSEDLTTASLTLTACLGAPADGELAWVVRDPNGEEVLRRTVPISAADRGIATDRAELARLMLWWPHDQGEQPLYTSEVMWLPSDLALATDIRVQRIGFRRVRLVMHEGAWREPSTFPKSRSHPPTTLEINGRRVFGKGTNWVHPDIFPGRFDREMYSALLQLAKDAHMNLLRVWGGGVVNKKSFFELCDEMGLMVWQEFPLACNLYPDDPAYLSVLDRESRSIVRRLRGHASLVLWCGGNELFNAWSGMTDQSLPLRLLNANCLELDSGTPFLMTSPLDGMGHGHYMFRYSETKDVLQAMIEADNTAYTEFGMPAPAPAELIRRFIPEAEWFPPRPGTSWESHHAFKALSDNMWLMEDHLEHYFGPSDSLEQLVERGQLLQSVGYTAIYEEARRQKPKCAMALNWCYNEPWPAAANNSIVCWPAVPKPGYYAVQAACRPVLASARIPRFDWREGEWFEPELWLLNDSTNALPPGSIEAWLRLPDGTRRLLMRWEHEGAGAGENSRGPTARFRMPAIGSGRMQLQLEATGHPEWNSLYTLLLKGAEDRAPARQLLNLQEEAME
ncbi:glycoside hydrolase family 2 protein [Cohnella fermenti]|uniref:beta-mannosidase n=1 Tax=Cohnella fermenti TaxID=2565925 RepID=A0A4S4BP53_9BACL|nr:hypothetical protein [Cohnella fermenti]THF76679.1 hypothetical protein E6C55_18075 [Cohnella fermenti]